MVRKKFARLKGLLVKLVVSEDAFGLRERKPYKVSNSFCPTGEGGGVDPTCSPKSISSPEEALEAYKSLVKRETDGSEEVVKLPNGREIHVALLPRMEKTSAGPTRIKWGLKIDFKIEGKDNLYVGKMVDKDSIAMLREVRRITEEAHGMGFHIIVDAADERRRELYDKFLGKIGIKKVGAVAPSLGRGAIYNLVQPVTNRFQFHSSPDKVLEFQKWLRLQFKSVLLGKSDEELWAEFAKRGYEKGAGRAFEDVNKKRRWRPGEGDFYGRSKQEFLKSSFGRAESTDKLRLLAGRSFTDLRNVTEDMATRMSRTLMDGLSRGANPRELVDDLVEDLGVSEARAESIARTEIIRAHAEGQLDAMEKLGVEEVGVAVEWDTAKDGRVCPRCRPLQGVVLTVDEAHGLIPNHPNAVFASSTFAPYGECEEIVRAWYSGPAVVLTLGSGEYGTTIGPNHPIMTRRGMVPAAQLRKGDQVLYDTRQDRSLHRVDREEVPTVQHVFETLLFVLGDSCVVSSSSDLHGDAVFCKGEVDAIRPARGLLPVLDSFGVEQLRQDDLARPNPDLKSRPGLSPSFLPGEGVGVTPPGVLSSGSLPSSLLGAHLRPLDSLGLALGPSRDAGSYESTIYRPSRYPEALGKEGSRFASLVTINNFFIWKIVHSVYFSRYDGWAFDATTATSLYYSDNLVVSNCRCAFVPANVGEDTSKQLRTKQEILDAFEEADVDPPELDEKRPEPLVEPTKNELHEFSRLVRSL